MKKLVVSVISIVIAAENYQESNMAGIVVKTVEELKAVQKTRSHPTIVIEGELASDLIISGIVQPKSDQRDCEGEVLQLKAINSHLYPIYQILWDLNRTNCFQIMGDNGPKRIRIYPRPSYRREGN
jgi:hypothetical protein